MVMLLGKFPTFSKISEKTLGKCPKKLQPYACVLLTSTEDVVLFGLYVHLSLR